MELQEFTMEEVMEIERQRNERRMELDTFFAANHPVIYMIKNKVNDKRYIGKSLHFDKRINEHKKTLLSKKHPNPKLQHDFNKYGIENFKVEVLENLGDLEEYEELSFVKEREYILEQDTKLLYNLTWNSNKYNL